ncbi:MAG: GntR family transcriptional regulator [Ilumatobacteraceae bacterium]
MRTIRYHQIADELRMRVTSGEYAAGRLMPSEAELSEEFAVSRMTVRKALEVLRDEGLVNARQGFGWFVAGETVRQPLARLATIEDQMRASGMKPERRILEFAFEKAPKEVARSLGSSQVLRVRRVNLADGDPFAIVTVWCSADLGQNLSRADVERSPFYELLDIPFSGATQTIGADAATADEAKILKVPAGSPVLRCTRTTTDTAGAVVLVSHHVFPAHRTEFVVDLPFADQSIAPSGLRLVE